MFLVDNFKIILLVGLVCTAGIRPSRAATKCLTTPKTGLGDPVSEACGDGKDTCFLTQGNLDAQGCKAAGDCPLNGKEVYCEKNNSTFLSTCCCKDDDCNSRKPDGKHHEEFCRFKDQSLKVEGCPQPMVCYDTKDEPIQCDSGYDVCFVAALPEGRLLPRDSLEVTINTEYVDLRGGKTGERGCKPRAKCPLEDGKEFECGNILCCCNTENCNSNSRAEDLFKKFCKTGDFHEKCAEVRKKAAGTKNTDDNDGTHEGDKPPAKPPGTGFEQSAATGLFQHYYGGFPFAVLVAASIYYFPLAAFF